MRKTAKYTAALAAAKNAKVPRYGALPHNDLYAMLQKAGLSWIDGSWQKTPAAKAGNSSILRIRVNAESDVAREAANEIFTTYAMKARSVTVSPEYPNYRKGTGVRIYIEVEF